MVTTCLLSSMQLRLLLHFIPAMLQYATQSAPYHTTSSADHWMETLLSHFSVFSPGNFEGLAQRWNQAALKPLSSVSTALKPPGKHSLAGHTGIVWGGSVRKLL